MKILAELSHVAGVVIGYQVFAPSKVLICTKCTRTRPGVWPWQRRPLAARGFLRCPADMHPMRPAPATEPSSATGAR